jgi:hypothetical protein
LIEDVTTGRDYELAHKGRYAAGYSSPTAALRASVIEWRYRVYKGGSESLVRLDIECGDGTLSRYEQVRRTSRTGLGPYRRSSDSIIDGWEAIQTRIAEQADQPEMEIIMLDKAPPPRTGLWILSAAAAVLLVVGSFVLLTRSDDDPAAAVAGDADTPEEIVDGEAPAPVEPTSVEAAPEVDPEADTAEAAADAEAEATAAAVAVAVAEQFMEARNAYDGDAVRALVADDAAISKIYEWIASPDDYGLLTNYERAHGMRFLDSSCAAGSPGRVRCSYTLESDVTVALGVGPYDASFLLEIADGVIQRVDHSRTADTGQVGTYFTDVKRGFGRWVSENHPDDTDLMYDPAAGNNVFPPFITAESVALWEQYIPEYIASLAAGDS